MDFIRDIDTNVQNKDIVNTYVLFFRYDKLIIDDNVYIYNDVEKRIERLPHSVSASAGLCLDDEVNRANIFVVLFLHFFLNVFLCPYLV